jgi:hypothetical protein
MLFPMKPPTFNPHPHTLNPKPETYQAHRHFYHSFLGLRVIRKKRDIPDLVVFQDEEGDDGGPDPQPQPPHPNP